MSPKIESGQLVTVEPVTDPRTISDGDIILCKVKGKHFLHLVVSSKHDQFLIGNNRGFTNGWTSARCVYGKCVKVEP